MTYAFTTYGGASPVTTSDSAANHFNGLIITATGNLVVTPAVGSGNITFTGLPCGAVIPFEVTKVLATGTTATVAGLV